MSKPARVTTGWVLRSKSGMYLEVGGGITGDRALAARFVVKSEATIYQHYPDERVRSEQGWRPVRLYRRVRGESK